MNSSLILTPDMLKEILAIESLQARIDLVSADYHSRADRFGRINAGDLLKRWGRIPAKETCANIASVSHTETTSAGPVMQPTGCNHTSRRNASPS